MDVRHADKELSRLEVDTTYTGGRAQKVVRHFRRVMLLIRGVPCETELYRFPSRHFEKLKGKRQHQHSLRICGQWRLVVEIEKGVSGNCIVIVEITDYH